MLGSEDAWRLGCCYQLLAVSYPPTLISPSNPQTLLLTGDLDPFHGLLHQKLVTAFSANHRFGLALAPYGLRSCLHDKDIFWEYYNPQRTGEQNELIATVMGAIRIEIQKLEFLD